MILRNKTSSGLGLKSKFPAFLTTLAGMLLVAGSEGLHARDFQLFEGDGFDTWIIEGKGFGGGPASAEVPGIKGKFTGYVGNSFACSGHGGEAAIGRLTSSSFTTTQSYLHFLIAGGNAGGKRRCN